MQYILQNIPDEIDRALRQRAESEHKSPEQAIIDALARDLGIKCGLSLRRDLSDIIGTWEVDPETEAVLQEQGRLAPEVETSIKKQRDLSNIAGKKLITPEMKAVFAEQRRIDSELWR